MRVQFGEFALERESRQRWRAGEELHLVPKAFDLLDLLLDERPRAVAKARIHDRLWPRTAVSATTLTSLVVDLRAALGDEAKQPRYIRTVRGFGYSFCGTALEPATKGAATSAPRLLLFWGDRSIPLTEGENILGRVDGAAICIEAPSVSRRHARIVVSGTKATLEDLGSKNGTFRGNQRLTQAARLTDGDEIRLGQVRMTYRVFAGASSSETVEA